MSIAAVNNVSERNQLQALLNRHDWHSAFKQADIDFLCRWTGRDDGHISAAPVRPPIECRRTKFGGAVLYRPNLKSRSLHLRPGFSIAAGRSLNARSTLLSLTVLAITPALNPQNPIRALLGLASGVF